MVSVTLVMHNRAMSSHQRIKASDVAEEAGVSVATVSYVLNDTPGQKISAATAARVREAAKRLGYVRNRAAQALARGDSRLVVIDMSAFPQSPATEQGSHEFNALIESRGYTAIQSWWGPSTPSDALIKLVRDTGAARVLSGVHPSEETCDALYSLGVKTISSILSPKSNAATAVEQTTVTQVNYLASRGHNHILYAPTTMESLSMLCDLRNATGKGVAEELGIRWTSLRAPSEVATYSDRLMDGLKQFPDTTAIAAFNDEIALRTLSYLIGASISVPDEMALIGAGNFPFTRYTYPPLTTAEYRYDISQLPDEVLTSMLEGPGVPGIASRFGDSIQVQVVERASV